jgi:dTDP-glucose 4,6-dehydratase
MRILVTGGAGFIAHHLIDELLYKTDAEIISLDRLDYSGNLNRLHNVLEINPHRKRVKIVYHDLKAEINPHVASHLGKIDVILHLAAGSHVDRSIDFPMEFALDNTIGTLNLLQYARTQDLKRFVYFSTDEVFGPAPEGVFYKENDRYNSTNPYSASKAAGEEFCVAFENTYGLPIYITHTMNVFGERQSPEKYIPMCVRRVDREEKITIHANPSKTKAGSRHYIHARDVADAMLFLLNHPTVVEQDYGGAKCPKFNIVGKEEWDNLRVAATIADIQKKPLHYEMVDFHSSRPGHDLRYALDGSKMEKMGWKPKIDITERLEQMVTWSLNHKEWL